MNHSPSFVNFLDIDKVEREKNEEELYHPYRQTAVLYTVRLADAFFWRAYDICKWPSIRAQTHNVRLREEKDK